MGDEETGGRLTLTGRMVDDALVAATYPDAVSGSFPFRWMWGSDLLQTTLSVFTVEEAIVRRNWVADPARGFLFANQDHIAPTGTPPWPITQDDEGHAFTIDVPEAEIQPLAGRVFVLGGCWDRNYYHWLLNTLQRITVARMLAPHLIDDPAIRIIVHQWLDAPLFRQTLASLGIDLSRVLWLSEDDVFRVERAIYVTYSRDYIPPVFSAMAATIKRGIPPDGVERPRRIWIDRIGDGVPRRVTNRDDISPVLDAHGFVPLRLETLSFAEQVALFAGAEAVAGVNGAGLANIFFCPPNCRVLIVEKRYTRRLRNDGLFRTLAEACGAQGRGVPRAPRTRSIARHA